MRMNKICVLVELWFTLLVSSYSSLRKMSVTIQLLCVCVSVKRNQNDKRRYGLTLRESKNKKEVAVISPLNFHSFVRCAALNGELVECYMESTGKVLP